MQDRLFPYKKNIYIFRSNVTVVLRTTSFAIHMGMIMNIWNIRDEMDKIFARVSAYVST